MQNNLVFVEGFLLVTVFDSQMWSPLVKWQILKRNVYVIWDYEKTENIGTNDTEKRL